VTRITDDHGKTVTGILDDDHNKWNVAEGQ
jgi:hypothetical protein